MWCVRWLVTLLSALRKLLSSSIFKALVLVRKLAENAFIMLPFGEGGKEGGVNEGVRGGWGGVLGG